MYQLRILVVVACSVFFPFISPVLAQTAAEPPAAPTPAPAPESNQLPPLVVEGGQAKKKAKKQSAKKGAVAAAPVASPQPAPPQTTPSEGSGETAYGPVDGYVATRTATGTKTDTPLIEIPQAISVVTRQQMDDRNVQNLNEALRYTAGVQAGDTADTTTESFSIRGFTTPYLSVYRDGLREMFRGFDSVTEPYGLERIEVLKGPASVLFGQGMPGGIVNLVTKRPTDVDLREVQFQAGSFDRYQAAFDFSGRAPNTDNVLYRLTFLGRDSDTQVDYVPDDRVYLAPSLTFRSDSRDTTLTLLSSFQRDDTSFLDGLPAMGTVLFNPNGKIPVSRFTGEPAWSDFERTSYTVGYIFDTKVTDAFSLHQIARFASSSYDRHQIQNRGLEADLQTIARRARLGFQESERFAIDSRAQYKFDAGFMKHDLIAGIDYSKAYFKTNMYQGNIDGLNIFNPVYGAPVSTPNLLFDDQETADQTGLYVQDQMKLWDSLNIVGGMRKDWASDRLKDKIGDTTAEQKDDAITYRLGAIYDMPMGLAPYVSYAESFAPVSGTDRLGDLFQPETGVQYEAGIKYQPVGSRTSITFAAFDLTRSNVLTPDPVDIDFLTQTGEIRTKGIEVEGLGNLTEEITFIATYTYNDAEVTKSNDIDLGKRPTTVPAHMASFWGNYEFKNGPFDGLSFGAGVRYIGNTPGDMENTFYVPSYTLTDAAIRYRYQGALFSLNANNVFDKEYVSTCYSDQSCYYGNGRSLIGSVTYKW
jgi:iron complex outermembrane recepter protein